MTCTYQKDPHGRPGEPAPESYPLPPHGCLDMQRPAGDGRQSDTQTLRHMAPRQTPRHMADRQQVSAKYRFFPMTVSVKPLFPLVSHSELGFNLTKIDPFSSFSHKASLLQDPLSQQNTVPTHSPRLSLAGLHFHSQAPLGPSSPRCPPLGLRVPIFPGETLGHPLE